MCPEEVHANIILVGNKCDKEKRLVTSDQVSRFQAKHKIDAYFETSAKYGEMVDHVFFTVAKRAVEMRMLKSQKKQATGIQSDKEQSKSEQKSFQLVPVQATP